MLTNFKLKKYFKTTEIIIKTKTVNQRLIFFRTSFIETVLKNCLSFKMLLKLVQNFIDNYKNAHSVVYKKTYSR